MSVDLAVVRFHGEGTAVERYAAARDGAIGEDRRRPAPQWTLDVGFVERHHNGRLLLRGTYAGHYLDVDEGDRLSQRGAGEGGVAGGLIGVLAGPPGIAVGLVLGAVVGSLAGSRPDVEEEPEALAAQLREHIPRSSSALVMIAPATEVDEMIAALGESATADTVRRTLTEDEAAALEASLGAGPRTPEADPRNP
ncbi:MAG TPA: DUF1269 domain-containing protein [Solirubrobacteraceae bacterium]|jgi:uncharacterized membrane protein